MKKVLIVAADGFSKTGVPFVFMNIVRNLSSQGFQFDIIYFDSKHNYYLNEFLSFGGKAFLFEKKNTSQFYKKIKRYFGNHSLYLNALKVIDQNGPYEIIHCFREYRSGLFLKAAKKRNIPIRIYHSNNIIGNGGNIINRILLKKEKKCCADNMTNLIGCSDKSCLSAFNNRINYQIINNPYDEKSFFLETKQGPVNKISLIQIGTFCENKNQLFSLKVLKNLLLMGVNAEIHFVGSVQNKNYYNKVKKIVLDNNLEKKVLFHNFDCYQKEVYDQSNYSICPSIQEAFGIVAIESQAIGLKCFASTALPETTNVGGCIRLSLSAGAKEWAAKILSDYKKTKGVRSLYDCSSFSNKNIIPKYFKLYNGETID